MIAPVLSTEEELLAAGVGVGVGSPVSPPPPVEEGVPVDEEGVPDGV